MSARVRRPAVAGSWYPGDRDGLVREIEGHLAEAARAALPGRLVALVSPHAGLRYSGPVAAHGYQLLRGRRGVCVVLVGPSHRSRFEGLAVWATGAFETPLGAIPIDEPLAQALIDAQPQVRDLSSPHLAEHSLEMQLPFLQHLVADLKIVPILMGTQSPAEIAALVQALEAAAGERDDVVLVASSDLSHYQPAPAAHALDRQVIERVERFDPDSLAELLESSWEHACGGGAIVSVMRAARMRGADRADVLRYADSGDAGERDKTRVVGYLSAALTAS